MLLAVLCCCCVAVFVAPAAVHGAHVTSCDEDCFAGSCEYMDCEYEVNCGGGRCMFTNCKSPRCSGGFCTFFECEDPTCDGGNCDFFSPKVRTPSPVFSPCTPKSLITRGFVVLCVCDKPRPTRQSTLTHGFCRGGRCRLEQKDAESAMEDDLTF